MKDQWLAFLGCALISLPLAPSLTAQTLSGDSATAIPSRLSRPPTATPGSSDPAQMTLTASVSTTPQFGSDMLWSAQDAIPAANMDELDAGTSVSPAVPEKANCRWALDVSNGWACTIKPFKMLNLPVSRATSHLWPLGNKSHDQ